MYDEETLEKLNKAYDEALRAREGRTKGALYGRPPFVLKECDELKECKKRLSVGYGIALELADMTKPYEGVVADSVKVVLGYIISEFERFKVERTNSPKGDFVTLAVLLVEEIERANYTYPCGVVDRLLARALTLLNLYVNN